MSAVHAYVCVCAVCMILYTVHHFRHMKVVLVFYHCKEIPWTRQCLKEKILNLELEDPGCRRLHVCHGRHDIGTVAETFITWFTESKQRESLVLAWAFKSHFQCHTFSNKATTKPFQQLHLMPTWLPCMKIY